MATGGKPQHVYLGADFNCEQMGKMVVLNQLIQLPDDECLIEAWICAIIDLCLWLACLSTSDVEHHVEVMIVRVTSLFV